MKLFPNDDNATYSSAEASSAINNTEHIYSSTLEVMYEKHAKDGNVPLDCSHGSRSVQGVPGEPAILMFLLFGIFLTAGWEGVTALLTVAL
jgi:hypothetical protein